MKKKAAPQKSLALQILDFTRKHRAATSGTLALGLGVGQNFVCRALIGLYRDGKLKRTAHKIGKRKVYTYSINAVKRKSKLSRVA